MMVRYGIVNVNLYNAIATKSLMQTGLKFSLKLIEAVIASITKIADLVDLTN